MFFVTASSAAKAAIPICLDLGYMHVIAIHVASYWPTVLSTYYCKWYMRFGVTFLPYWLTCLSLGVYCGL